MVFAEFEWGWLLIRQRGVENHRDCFLGVLVKSAMVVEHLQQARRCSRGWGGALCGSAGDLT